MEADRQQMEAGVRLVKEGHRRPSSGGRRALAVSVAATTFAGAHWRGTLAPLGARGPPEKCCQRLAVASPSEAAAPGRELSNCGLPLSDVLQLGPFGAIRAVEYNSAGTTVVTTLMMTAKTKESNATTLELNDEFWSEKLSKIS